MGRLHEWILDLTHFNVKNNITNEITIINGAIPANSGRYVVPITLVVVEPVLLNFKTTKVLLPLCNIRGKICFPFINTV